MNNCVWEKIARRPHFGAATVKFVAHYLALKEHSKVSEVIGTALLYSSGAAALIIGGIAMLAPMVHAISRSRPLM